jgi:hypothetical protein
MARLIGPWEFTGVRKSPIATHVRDAKLANNIAHIQELADCDYLAGTGGSLVRSRAKSRRPASAGIQMVALIGWSARRRSAPRPMGRFRIARRSAFPDLGSKAMEWK